MALDGKFDGDAVPQRLSSRISPLLQVVRQRISQCSDRWSIRKLVVVLLHSALARAPLVVELSADESLLPQWIRGVADGLAALLGDDSVRHMFAADEYALRLCCVSIAAPRSDVARLRCDAAMRILAKFCKTSTVSDDLCTVPSRPCRTLVARLARAGFAAWAKSHIRRRAADVNIATAHLHERVVLHDGAAIPAADEAEVAAVRGMQREFMRAVSCVAAVCRAVVAANATPEGTDVATYSYRGTKAMQERAELELDAVGFEAVPVSTCALDGEFAADERAVPEFVLRLLSSGMVDLLVRATVLPFKSLLSRDPQATAQGSSLCPMRVAAQAQAHRAPLPATHCFAAQQPPPSWSSWTQAWWVGKFCASTCAPLQVSRVHS